jgi:hypothetical protein
VLYGVIPRVLAISKKVMACTDYNMIQEQEKQNTAEFSNWVFSLYLRIHLVLRFIYCEKFIWGFTFVPFVVFAIFYGPNFYLFLLFAHLVYWELFGRDKYHELFYKQNEDIVELELTIKALRVLKKEREIKLNNPMKD